MVAYDVARSGQVLYIPGRDGGLAFEHVDAFIFVMMSMVLRCLSAGLDPDQVKAEPREDRRYPSGSIRPKQL